MKQNLIERILAKTVGLELSTEEMDLVAGGMFSLCNVPDLPYWTVTADAQICDA